jgi:hypothetical protein
VQLLQQEVQAVLRQAQALQQLVALQQEQAQGEEERGQVSQLVQAEAQVEVLAAEQVRELVEVPLLEVE